MTKYMTLNGDACQSDNPKRGLWYSAGCTYWTDDWDELSSVGGIPCCPSCQMVGCQTTAEDWFNGAAIYQKNGNPGYLEFLNQSKNHCMGRATSFLKWFKKWLQENPNGKGLPRSRRG